MGFEYEWKFRATEQTLEAILASTPGQAHPITMQTTYYDTPSAQLAARRYTLRTRLENGVSVCTLKTPGKGLGRQEWEVRCDRIEDAVEMLCKLGVPEELPALLKEGLVPVCGARFHRTALTVTLDDCAVELALDKGILTGGGRELPLCEVEVELKSGSLESCDRYAAQLARQFDLQQETKSKFRRALELSKGEWV